MLEQSLLAIDALANVARTHCGSGNDPLEHCAYLLEHLIEPALYQVEALRQTIDALPSRVKDSA